MRSIIYAAYSKDLSVKTTAAKIQMMKQGKYVGGYAPYGYVLHPTIRNKLADVVFTERSLLYAA